MFQTNITTTGESMDLSDWWNFSHKGLSPYMRFPTMWYVQLAKPQFQPAHTQSLIRAFASHLNIETTDSTPFGVSKLKKRLHRLVLVYTCQIATLLEITCGASFIKTTSAITTASISIKYNPKQNLCALTYFLLNK